jgi:hypothetical protein
VSVLPRTSWVRSDGSVRVVVEISETPRHVDLSVDYGRTWDALGADEARQMAAVLVNCADRIEGKG